ncbi:pyruvate formate lyase family protein [Neomoorella mulderi]|uniref:Benzylsuccinate synthase alpha subunit n=1 Tax=Moorella mulderi DSM 14980 TaxID=1122241 RepID=A0A151AX32_9FIRM|nr:pyruvate formate lyase family protein [Moorella mulderi]KYH32205.1 benzylsuccinate synthase alpha subunit [Moorella mulderi DSM 14980]
MALSERIARYKEEHVPKHFWKEGYVKPVYLSILRSRAYTKVWKETEGEPTSIRRAKALAEYLDTMPIFIRPHELLVGFYAEDPHALPVCIESTEPDFIKKIIADGNVKQEEVGEWNELLAYWADKGLNKLLLSRLTEKELKLAKADHTFMEVLPTQYTTRSQAEYDLVLENGLNGIKKILQEKVEKLDEARENCVGGREAVEINNKQNDVKAMIIAVEAVIRWANRYSELARRMAKEEKDPARKKELEQIARICANVPANPANSFWEAVQSHWLTFLACHVIEQLSHGTSLRLDQIFWKWYEKDVILDKTLPREKALELMEEFLLKIDELGRPLPLVWRKSLQGNNYLATYTIGGTKPEDGSDACNDMTILICDALDELWINHPDFKFRWHPKVNPRAYERVLELQRKGLGQPSIKNEDIAIATLIDHYGFTLEEARSWAVVGCISPAPTINWGRCRRDAWTVYPAKILELTFFNGVNPTTGEEIGIKTGDARDHKTFEEFFEAYRKQFAWVMRTSARIKTIAEECNNQLCKRPFLSALFRRSLESCRDIMDTPEKGMPWVNVPGIVDACDSLISLKKLVFDDKKYTMSEVLEALKSNWEGYEEMRQDFINAPKFGNNDDYADEVAKKTYAMIAEEMSKVKDINNASPMPSGLIITWMFSTADKVGALPNGRKLGDWLTDGGISPHAGYDRKGPMAAILSAAKIDHRKQKANIFNQKLSPSCIEGEAGFKKFKDYVTTILNLGLDMIQFNVVDAKTLRDAQQHPEKYPNLVVRVSGYNAKFVEMDKFVQDAIIERTQHVI